jgi:hypothetical protein
MSDDDTIKVEGTAEVQEKRVAAGVDDGRINHETQPPGEPQAVEEKKRRLVEAYMASRAAPSPATAAPAKGTKANQGSVIAIVAVAVVFLLVLIGFAVLMWRISKGESALREYVLTKV